MRIVRNILQEPLPGVPMPAQSSLSSRTAATTMADLEPGEMLLVWGARYWRSCLRQGRASMPILWDVFHRNRIDQAVVPLSQFLDLIACQALRPAEIRCTACRYLGADEMRIAQAIALAQRQATEPAATMLSSWLAPADLIPGVAMVCDIALILEQARWVLPLRNPACLAGRRCVPQSNEPEVRRMSDASKLAPDSQMIDSQTIGMGDLDDTERLLIWSYRHWVSGAEHHPLIRHAFSRHIGHAAAALGMVAFETFMHALRLGAARVIHYHPPCCPYLCADEICVLLLIASMQHGDHGHARKIAGWLVRRDRVDATIAAAGDLATVFEDHGLSFTRRGPAPAGTPSDGPAAEVRPTIH